MKPFSPEDIQRLSFDFMIQEDQRPQLLKEVTAPAPTCDRYLRFLYEFARKYEPQLIVETGTDQGRSAAHFALGAPAAKMVTIDIDPACKENVDRLKIPNVISVAIDSLIFADTIADGSVDVLFLDSLHTYDHSIAEYRKYLPKVHPGGVIFFDDIALDAGMKQFWREVTGRRMDLSHLHFSGFGAVSV